MTGTAATAVSALASASTSPLARRHSNIPESCGPRHSSSRYVVATLLLRTLSLGPVTNSRLAFRRGSAQAGSQLREARPGDVPEKACVDRLAPHAQVPRALFGPAPDGVKYYL